MTKKDIATIAAEFQMREPAFRSSALPPYFRHGTLAVDIDFGLCGGELYIGLIFESEMMADRNAEHCLPLEETTPDQARAILRRLFRIAHIHIEEAVALTEGEALSPFA